MPFFSTGLEIAWGFPGGSAVENLPAVQGTGDAGSTPWWGRSPEEEMATYCGFLALENPVDRGAWWATVHGVTKESETTYLFSD